MKKVWQFVFGSQKRPEVKCLPQSESDKIYLKKIYTQTVLYNLEMKIKTFEKDQKQYDDKVVAYRTKAKELINTNEMNEFRKSVEQAIKAQKLAQICSTCKMVFSDQKQQLEKTIIDKEGLDSLGNATLNDLSIVIEKLIDLMTDQEAKMQQQKIIQNMKDMARNQPTKQQIEQMENQIMRELGKTEQPQQKDFQQILNKMFDEIESQKTARANKISINVDQIKNLKNIKTQIWNKELKLLCQEQEADAENLFANVRS